MSCSNIGRGAASRQAPRRRSVFALLALLLLGVAACEGDNLFTGNPPAASGGPPATPLILVSDIVDEGARLDVRVRAVAPAGMANIQLRYRRAVNDEQSFPTQPRTDTVTVDATLQLPAEVADSILVIEAFVTDVGGRVSEIARREIYVRDRSAPSVSAILTPTSASMGDTVRVRVNARDNAGLRSVGFAIINPAGDTLPGSRQFIQVAGAAVDTVFAFALPKSLQPAQFKVVGLAVNSADLRGVSAPLQLSVVDLLPPSVRITTPSEGDSYPLSDSILVRVQVADSGGVAEVRLRGVAIRRDSLQNTQVVVRYAEKVVTLPGLPTEQAPRDTTIVRFLLPTGGNASEEVYLIATAKDVAGNTRADTVRIMDGPRIQIMNPADSATVGINRTLLVHVNAVDRSAGLDSVKLVLSGVQTGTIALRNLAPLEVLDTTIAVNIGSTLGILNLQPQVWNRRGAGGIGTTVRVNVSPVDATDNVRPQVSRRITTQMRLELRDTIRVSVRATDGPGSGVARMGMVAVVIPDTDALPRREVYRSSAVFSPPLSGTPERNFEFTLGEVYDELESAYPRKFTLQVHAFAVDAAGNCGASVGEQLAASTCELVVGGSGTYNKAAGLTPASLQVTGTVGRSVRLPGGGRIADAVVDESRRRIYFSNIENNKVDIFVLGADTFAVTNSQTRRGLVGAAPWGLVISNGNDSLYVANSGGTNISVLPLDGPAWMIEDLNRRILTPNIVLHEIVREIGNGGAMRYIEKNVDFSDRPQFLAQHATGTLVYSTLPTPAARDGTIRYIDMNAGSRPESYLLGGVVKPAENSISIANLDSLVVVPGSTGNDEVILYDRTPGTDNVLKVGPLPIDTALIELHAAGSDVEWFAGSWDAAGTGLADTTFVAASSNRSTIAFGEGARGPFGRIFICCTISQGPPLRLGVSKAIEVRDLINNAAERVFGLGLNFDGSLGVARGTNAAYYFSRDLRLQGEFRAGMAGGAGGASLHPLHGAVLESGDRALSFVPTADRTIKIIDSAHFYERGEIHIRDNVVGPVRAFLPSASDNAGFAQNHPNYIVAKLIAVTQGSNVVIIDVRRRDIQN